MNFDGWKYYFRAQKPTNKDLTKYSSIEITPSLPHEHQHRYLRRLDTSKIYIEDRRARLGFLTYKFTKLNI